MWAKQVWLKDGVLQTYDNSWKPIGPAPEPVAVTGVSLNQNSLTLGIEESARLTVTVSPSDATNKRVTWSSQDTSIATVSSTWNVTGKANGNTTITVTTQDGWFTDNCSVTVTDGQSGVQSVQLMNYASWTTLTGYVGRTQSEAYIVNPYTASNLNVTVTSSNENVVRASSRVEEQPSEWVSWWIDFEFGEIGNASITITSVDNPSATATYYFEVEEYVPVTSIYNVSNTQPIVFPWMQVYRAVEFDYDPYNASDPYSEIFIQLKEWETAIGATWLEKIGNNHMAINFFTNPDAQVWDSATYELFVNGSYGAKTDITFTVGEPVESISNLTTSTITMVEWNGDSVSFNYSPTTANVSAYFWVDGGQNVSGTVDASSPWEARLYVSWDVAWQWVVYLKSRDGNITFGSVNYEVIPAILPEQLSNLSATSVTVEQRHSDTSITVDYTPTNINSANNIYLQSDDDQIAYWYINGYQNGVMTLGISWGNPWNTHLTIYMNGEDTGLGIDVTVVAQQSE